MVHNESSSMEHRSELLHSVPDLERVFGISERSAGGNRKPPATVGGESGMVHNESASHGA
jgi:hypothetical protein